MSDSKPLIELQEYSSIQEKKLISSKDIGIKSNLLDFQTTNMNFEIEEVKEGAKLENNIFNIPSMPPLSMRGKTQQQNGGRMQMLSSVRPSIPVSQFEQIKPMTQNKARRAISPNLFEPETKQLSSVSTRSKGHTHFLSILLHIIILDIQKSPSAQNVIWIKTPFTTHLSNRVWNKPCWNRKG